MEATNVSVSPPEWVCLPEARAAIARRYGERAPEIIDNLRELLPEGFPHRVSGWHSGRRQWDFRTVPFHPGDDARRAPAWLAEDCFGQMQVQDWDLARVDWDAGTVMNFGGHRSTIELRWRHITEWARTGSIAAAFGPSQACEPEATLPASVPLELPSWDEVKRQEAESVVRDAISTAVSASKVGVTSALVAPADDAARPKMALAMEDQGPAKHGTAVKRKEGLSKPKRVGRSSNGGRRIRPKVHEAMLKLAAKVTAVGVPEPNDGVQAILERWFIAVIEEAGETISEGRARVHVRRVLNEARLALAS
jgi:hypothetical protein